MESSFFIPKYPDEGTKRRLSDNRDTVALAISAAISHLLPTEAIHRSRIARQCIHPAHPGKTGIEINRVFFLQSGSA